MARPKKANGKMSWEQYVDARAKVKESTRVADEVKAAADQAAAWPCPSTIKALDEANARLDKAIKDAEQALYA